MTQHRQRKVSHSHSRTIVLALVAFLALLLLFFVIYDNSRVAVAKESITIGGLSKNMEGFTILHISDLHGKEFGQNQANLLSAIAKEDFDVVTITGNMAGENPEAAYLLAYSLSQMRVPVLFITGDNDPAALNEDAGESALSDYVRNMRERGAIYLDAPHKMDVDGETVWFLPEHQMSLDIEATRGNLEQQRASAESLSGEERAVRLRNLEYQLDVLNRLEEARASFSDGDINIALLRIPLSVDFLDTIQGWSDAESGAFLRRLHLVLAGHYNGGQWRLAGQPLWVPANHLPRGGLLPDPEQISGLISVNGLYQYTSPGLGISPIYPPWMGFRLFNPPTITLIHLTAQVD